MDDQVCPRCRTTKYRNPSMKLMVNICGHILCESCVELLFVRGSGFCPECNVILKRTNFRVQLFEDPMVEKEVDIRRRILRDYNKKEDDFETEAEYNDYLEEIETLIYNLVNNIDIINTNKRIEMYKRENREIIQRNKQRIGRDESELQELIELEKVQNEARRAEIEEFELEQKKVKIRERDSLIDKLMAKNSNKDAKTLVKEFAKKVEKIREEEKKLPPPKSATQFSTGIKFALGSEKMFLPVPKADDAPLYVYEAPKFETEGPPPPSVQDIERNGFINNVRPETAAERAGGFKSTMACQRALQEAFQGLFPKPHVTT